MSGDSYYRHKVVMEVGSKKRSDGEKRVETFMDDRELLAYLLDREKRDIQALHSERKSGVRD